MTSSRPFHWAHMPSLSLLTTVALLITLAFSLPSPAAAQATMKLQAASVDGTNSGTARLGMHVQLTPIVTGSSSIAVTWTLQGAGTLSTAGLYAAPTTMPSSTSVKVTAILTSSPSVTASYSFTLVNPAPYIGSVKPSGLPRGTSSVNIGGTGFVPGTSIRVNGSAVPTTYVSPTQVNAQVTIATNATGTVSFTAFDPAPAGGTSAAVSATIANPGLTLQAASADGTNTGTARLGLHVQLTPLVTGTTNTAVTWTLQGAGTLTTAGLYTAPNTVGSTPSVTISATLVAYPSVTASYHFSLVNPVPLLYWIKPITLTATTNSLTVAGASIVPGATVLVNGAAVTTTYQSWNAVTTQINASVGQATSVSLVISNPAPGGGKSTAITLPIAVPKTTSVQPATLGTGSIPLTVTGSNYTSSSVVFVNGEAVPTTYVSPTKLTATGFVAPWNTTSVQIGVGDSTIPTDVVTVPVSNKTAVTYDAAARFSMQAAFGPRPDLVMHIQQVGFSTFLNEQFAQPASTYPTASASSDLTKIQFTYNALNGSNVLRQRVALGLEEFITASIINGYIYPTAVPWQQLMEKDAFANFRTLLNDVTLNNTMGNWLNLGNNWAPTNAALHPNQNYARELLQLFTMGPVKLNNDGSTVLDSSGRPVPTYDASTILDLSRALTGWAMPPVDSSAYAALNTDFAIPLQATDSKHDHGAKVLFGSTTLPAGQTITQDETAALNAVFNHPNVPPFISRLLIQHLVKSDPSAAYIQRISEVFENDGTGVRGNLQAVVRAILLDPEARAGDDGTVAEGDGHLQEPILYFLAVMNGLQDPPTTTALVYAERGLGEYIWNPESVFSFYSPSFNIPGTSINAPEFQLYDANYLPQRSQILYSIIAGKETGFNSSYRQTSWLLQNFSTIPNLLDAVDHMFFHGTMPAATKQLIESYVATLPNPTDQQTQALYLALNSDAFQISH